jgi:hypothetical protein
LLGYPQFFTSLFCRSWIALVGFRKVRGLLVFLPFLNFRIAHSATLDWRDRSLEEIRAQAKQFSTKALLSLRSSHHNSTQSRPDRASLCCRGRGARSGDRGFGVGECAWGRAAPRGVWVGQGECVRARHFVSACLHQYHGPAWGETAISCSDFHPQPLSGETPVFTRLYRSLNMHIRSRTPLGNSGCSFVQASTGA